MKKRALFLMLAAAQIAFAQADRFSGRGVQVGQKVPALELVDANGEKTDLSNVWKNDPALIVTGSLTCPIARRECPLLEKTLSGLKGVNTVIVYTVEAHPQGDANPYGGKTDTPQINVSEGIVHRQPKKLSERMTLMKDFVKRTGITFPVLVDNMDNRAWTALGGGPNLAVLVNQTGTVVAKQGWLDPDAMRAEVEKLTAK